MQLLKQNSLPLYGKSVIGVEKINKRRYLGNKYALSYFIRSIVRKHCHDIQVVGDIFSGTGSVADLFKEHTLITNDLLYSNYLSHVAWFSPADYNEELIMDLIRHFNSIVTSEDNYVRDNFAGTFFSPDNCSKIGWIRETIEQLKVKEEINFKEYSMLITSLLYAMDRIANTVGHYDAYRKGIINDTPIQLRETVARIIGPNRCTSS